MEAPAFLVAFLYPCSLRITLPKPAYTVLTDTVWFEPLPKQAAKAASRGSVNRTGKPGQLPALPRSALHPLLRKGLVTPALLLSSRPRSVDSFLEMYLGEGKG